MYTIRQGERTDYNYKEIFCDTQNDFDTLDLNSAEFQKICAGSVAYVIETSNVYILNSKGEWVAQSSGGGGGGGDIHNQDKTITENGEYTADPGYTGLGTVTVDVEKGDVSDYFVTEFNTDTNSQTRVLELCVQKLPIITVGENVTSLVNAFLNAKRITEIEGLNILSNNITTTARMFEGCSALKNIPYFDTSNVTNMSYMFSGCASITTIPYFDTSNVTNMSYMFQNCVYLVSLPLLDTSNVTDMRYMFFGNDKLIKIPQFDTSKVTNISGAFVVMHGQTSVLQEIPELDFSSVTNLYNMIWTNMYSVYSLTTLGGFKNLGKAYLTTSGANNGNYTLSLTYCPNLTHDSLMNVINDLYDIASAGVQTQRLLLGVINKAKLTAEEIAIATNKGWTVS